MKRAAVFLLVLLLPLCALADGLDLSGVSFTEEQTRAMSNFMNMGRYITVGEELWGRSWNNHIFRATPVIKKNKLTLENASVVQESTVALYFCADEEYVYCVLEEFGLLPQGIVSIRVSDGNINRLYDGPAAYLQLSGDSLIFTDEQHRLTRMDKRGGQTEILLDKAVYYPYLLDDRLLLCQEDADGESLHAVDLSTGEDIRLLDCHVFCYIIAGGELYYCYHTDEDSNCRLGCLNLQTGEDTRWDFYTGSSVFIDGDRMYFADDTYAELSSKLSDHKNIRNYATTRLSYLYSNGECYVRYGWKSSSDTISRMSVYPCGISYGGDDLEIR